MTMQWKERKEDPIIQHKHLSKYLIHYGATFLDTIIDMSNRGGSGFTSSTIHGTIRTNLGLAIDSIR